MSLIKDGTEINSVIFNGVEIERILYNGNEVWSSAPAPLYLRVNGSGLSGTVTVPKTGTYNYYATSYWDHAAYHGDVYGWLKKNGAGILTIFKYDADNNTSGTKTASGKITLSKGDVLQLSLGNDCPYGYHNFYMSFTYSK